MSDEPSVEPAVPPREAEAPGNRRADRETLRDLDKLEVHELPTWLWALRGR